jgi:hypothetical protein
LSNVLNLHKRQSAFRIGEQSFGYHSVLLISLHGCQKCPLPVGATGTRRHYSLMEKSLTENRWRQGVARFLP